MRGGWPMLELVGLLLALVAVALLTLLVVVLIGDD